MFEIYTMVSEIHDSVNLVPGVKNFVELEGEISMRKLNFTLLKTAASIIHVRREMIEPKERRYVEIEGPFLHEISGFGLIKLLGLNTYDTVTMKVKFERNKALL